MLPHPKPTGKKRPLLVFPVTEFTGNNPDRVGEHFGISQVLNIRDIHAVGHPVPGPSGDFVEIVGSLMDVTERKPAEKARNETDHFVGCYASL
jgi:hypothetical protein